MASKNLQKSSAIQNISITLSSVIIAIFVCNPLFFSTIKLQQISLIAKFISTYNSSNSRYNIIGNANAFGETIHLTSEHLRTWIDILNIYSTTFKNITGKDIKVKMVPLEKFIKCRNKGLEYQVLYDRVYDRDFDTSKESRLANSGTFIEPEEGLKNCLSEFLISNYRFNQINYRNEALKDKLTKERFSISSIPTLKQRLQYFINRYIL